MDDGEKPTTVEEKVVYLIGAPERADRNETLFRTDDESEANVVLSRIVDATTEFGATPRLWKDGKEVAPGEFFF